MTNISHQKSILIDLNKSKPKNTQTLRNNNCWAFSLTQSVLESSWLKETMSMAFGLLRLNLESNKKELNRLKTYSHLAVAIKCKSSLTRNRQVHLFHLKNHCPSRTPPVQHSSKRPTFTRSNSRFSSLARSIKRNFSIDGSSIAQKQERSRSCERNWSAIAVTTLRHSIVPRQSCAATPVTRRRVSRARTVPRARAACSPILT